MKKLLLVLAIGAFAACNDSATSTENAVDTSANATVDSLTVDTSASTTTVDTTTTTTTTVDTTKH